VKKLFLIVGAFVGFVTLANGPLRAEQAAPAPLKQQITDVAQTYNTAYQQWFNPNFLASENTRNTLAMDKLGWDAAIESLMQLATELENAALSSEQSERIISLIKYRLNALQAMLADYQRAYSTLLLFTSSPYTTSALANEPLTDSMLQECMAVVGHQLTKQLRKDFARPLSQINEQPTRLPLANLIAMAFYKMSYVLKPWYYYARLKAFWCSSIAHDDKRVLAFALDTLRTHYDYDAGDTPIIITLGAIVDAAWETAYPDLAHAYYELMHSIHLHRYTCRETSLVPTIIAQADSCLKLVAAQQNLIFTTPTTEQNFCGCILNAIAAQLIAIKHEMGFTEQITTAAAQSPAVLSIIKRHYYLVQSSRLEKLRTAILNPFYIDRFGVVARVVAGILSPYYLERIGAGVGVVAEVLNARAGDTPNVTVVDCYKATIAMAIERLLAQQVVPADLIFALESCRDDLDQLRFAYARSMVVWGVMGEHPLISTIDMLIANIRDAISLADPSANGVIAYIMSGKWLSSSLLKGITKGQDGGFSLDFADDLMKKANVPNLQAAGLYALISASPFAIKWLIDYIRPRLDGSLKEQAEQALREQNQAKQQAKLMDFVTQNPAVFNELVKAHPELMESLATAVTGLVKPSQKGA
jgi:hypothetical protein